MFSSRHHKLPSFCDSFYWDDWCDQLINDEEQPERSQKPVNPQTLAELEEAYSIKPSVFWDRNDKRAPVRKAFPFEGNKGPGDKATIVLLQNEISCVDSEGAFSSSTVVQELDGIEVEKETLKSESSGEGELSIGTTEKRCLVELFEDEKVVEELRVESPARADGPFEAVIETYFAEDLCATRDVKSTSLTITDLRDINGSLSPQAAAFSPGVAVWPPGLMTMSPDEVKGLHNSLSAPLGEDVGTITSRTPVSEFREAPLTAGFRDRDRDRDRDRGFTSSGEDEIRNIIRRVATQYEKEDLIMKKAQEEDFPLRHIPVSSSLPMTPEEIVSLPATLTPRYERAVATVRYSMKSDAALQTPFSRYNMPPPPQHSIYHRQQNEISGTIPSADGYVTEVHFKRASMNFISPENPIVVSVGDIVRVEADRGIDAGTVVAKVPVHEFKAEPHTAGFRGRGFKHTDDQRIRYIVSLADEEDKKRLINKTEEEGLVLQKVREMVFERALCMSILDVEYQFDHHKLTVFFEADQRVDFRDLVSELFSLYKTRIWMQQIEVEQRGSFGLDTSLGSPLRTCRSSSLNSTSSTFSSSFNYPLNSPDKPALGSPLSVLSRSDDFNLSPMSSPFLPATSLHSTDYSLPHKSHISSPDVRYPRITRIFPAIFSELYCSPPVSPSVDAALEQNDDIPVTKDSIPHRSHISSPDVRYPRITRTFPAIFSELYCSPPISPPVDAALEQDDDLPVCPECGRVKPET